MAAIETVDPRVVRDTSSMALLSVDEGSLARSRASISANRKTEARFTELDSRMKNIEKLLEVLVSKGQ